MRRKASFSYEQKTKWVGIIQIENCFLNYSLQQNIIITVIMIYITSSLENYITSSLEIYSTSSLENYITSSLEIYSTSSLEIYITSSLEIFKYFVISKAKIIVTSPLQHHQTVQMFKRLNVKLLVSGYFPHTQFKSIQKFWSEWLSKNCDSNWDW